jgi:GT2 family glycosyltransferase
VERIGVNDPGFLHTLGDIDYGLRATKAGIPNYVMPNTFGICEVNEIRRFERLPFRERLKQINTPFGLPFRNWFRMTARWSGVWMPFHFVLPYRKLILGS